MKALRSIRVRLLGFFGLLLFVAPVHVAEREAKDGCGERVASNEVEIDGVPDTLRLGDLDCEVDCVHEELKLGDVVEDVVCVPDKLALGVLVCKVVCEPDTLEL